MPIRQSERRLVIESGIGIVARYRQSAAQSIPNATTTVIIWNTVVRANPDLSLNVGSGVVTVLRAMDALICGIAGFAPNAVGSRAGIININGTEEAASSTGTATAAAPACLTPTLPVKLSVGDTISLSAFQDSGIAINTYTGGTQYGSLTIIPLN